MASLDWLCWSGIGPSGRCLEGKRALGRFDVLVIGNTSMHIQNACSAIFVWASSMLAHLEPNCISNFIYKIVLFYGFAICLLV